MRSFNLPRLLGFAVNEYGLFVHSHMAAARLYPELATPGRAFRGMVGVPPRGLRWDGTEYARFGTFRAGADERDVLGSSFQADSSHLWFASQRKYAIDLVAADGSIVRQITRNVLWFPVDTAKSDFPWVKRPPTRIIGLTAIDSVLWVLISRASKDWENRRPANPPVMKPGMPITMMMPYARTDLFEFVIEALDARSGKLLASMDLPGDFRGFTQSRELMEHVADSTGAVTLRVWQPALTRR